MLNLSIEFFYTWVQFYTLKYSKYSKSFKKVQLTTDNLSHILDQSVEKSIKNEVIINRAAKIN